MSLLELVGRFRRLVGAVLLAEAPVAVVGQLAHRLLRRKETKLVNQVLTCSDPATSNSFYIPKMVTFPILAGSLTLGSCW